MLGDTPDRLFRYSRRELLLLTVQVNVWNCCKSEASWNLHIWQLPDATGWLFQEGPSLEIVELVILGPSLFTITMRLTRHLHSCLRSFPVGTPSELCSFCFNFSYLSPHHHDDCLQILALLIDGVPQRLQVCRYHRFLIEWICEEQNITDKAVGWNNPLDEMSCCCSWRFSKVNTWVLSATEELTP